MTDQTVKGIVSIARVTGRHERVGNLRPADAAAALPLRGREHCLAVDGTPERLQPLGHLAHPSHAIRTLAAQKRLQYRTSWIDEVREHVDVASILNSGNLDAIHQAEAVAFCRLTRFRETGESVMVGHAQHGDARCSRASDESGGRQRTV